MIETSSRAENPIQQPEVAALSSERAVRVAGNLTAAVFLFEACTQQFPGALRPPLSHLHQLVGTALADMLAVPEDTPRTIQYQ